MNVLLVDDEVLAIEYLKQLIDWDAEGFIIVGEAHNGRKALELCQSMEVDIVISDIRMPGMDGIELIRLLKEQRPSVKVLLLSSYKDFDYAKSAIQYDVSNYLIKHEMNGQVLLEELNKVRTALVREERSKATEYKSVLRDLIYSIEEAVDVRRHIFGGDYYGYVMMMLKHGQSPLSNGMTDGAAFNGSMKMQRLIEITKTHDYDDLKFLTELEINETHTLVVFAKLKHMSDMVSQRVIGQVVNQIFLDAKTQAFFALRVLTSRPISLSEMPRVFRKLAEGIRYSLFMDFAKTYFVDELPMKEDENLTKQKLSNDYLEEQMDHELLSDLNDEALLVHLCSIYEKLSQPSWDLRRLKDWLGIMNRLIIKSHRSVETGGQYVDVGDEFKSSGEMIEVYAKNLVRAVGRLMDQEAMSYSNTINEVMTYIHGHINEKLTLDMMGEVFDMNGVYIGQLFKKEVGTTFLKYMTNHRIELAKDYLIHTRMTATEIADRLGYASSQYFTQIFSKHVGMTPQAFRKWGKEND